MLEPLPRGRRLPPRGRRRPCRCRGRLAVVRLRTSLPPLRDHRRSSLRAGTEPAEVLTPSDLHAAASALSHAELLNLVAAWATTDPELAEALRARAGR